MTVHESNRQTDRQTDRQDYYGNTMPCTIMRRTVKSHLRVFSI